VNQTIVNRSVLILVLICISALFFYLMLPFLQAIFLAAIFAALFTPLYRRLLALLGERQALASGLTLLVVLMFVFVPLILVVAAVIAQAIEVAETARPWILTRLRTPGTLTGWFEMLPFHEKLLPYREQTLARAGDLAGTVSSNALTFLRSATVGTFNALLNGAIILYTMFFFLMNGDRLLFYVLYYLPLDDHDETQLLRRFGSVTRATLKGTAVIGILQGGLAGLALYAAGVPSALFWAVVMMFLSVVPAIGTALIWVPAVIWLAVSGQPAAAAGVAAFCTVVVGLVDNLLRPRLVGNDAKLHDLMIFFSTLGGLLVFGFTGFIIGPIVAALFVTVWELYGEEFRDWLPSTAFRPHSGPVELPHERAEARQRPRELNEVLAGRGSETAQELDPDGATSSSEDGAAR